MSHPFPSGPADPAARRLVRPVSVLPNHRAQDEPVPGRDLSDGNALSDVCKLKKDLDEGFVALVELEHY